jgi:EpsI family protein
MKLSEWIGALLLGSVLLAVGGLAWSLQLRPALDVDASALEDLPFEIDGWFGSDIPLESAVERELDAQVNVQRRYRRRSGETLWLYIGYYGTERGGRPEHTPRGCYTGAGWTIESARSLPVGGSALAVNEFRVSRDGESLLVHFWYRSHRRSGMLGGLDQNLDRMLGRIADGRADGALVRVSAPLGSDDESAVRSQLFGFAVALEGELGTRWPRETPSAAIASLR